MLDGLSAHSFFRGFIFTISIYKYTYCVGWTFYICALPLSLVTISSCSSSKLETSHDIWLNHSPLTKLRRSPLMKAYTLILLKMQGLRPQTPLKYTFISIKEIPKLSFFIFRIPFCSVFNDNFAPWMISCKAPIKLIRYVTVLEYIVEDCKCRRNKHSYVFNFNFQPFTSVKQKLTPHPPQPLLYE